MTFSDLPIRRKLMTILLLITGATLTLTCLAFIGYEYVSFRAAATEHLATLGRVISSNSTAALAFDNHDDAQQVLAALKAEPHVVAAGLYDTHGTLFARYPARLGNAGLPAKPGPDGYRFEDWGLVGVEPVREGNNSRLGTLYLRSDLNALHQQLILYSAIAAGMTTLAFLMAYVLSRVLQKQISGPIQMLARAARTVSEERDYSVRVPRLAADELGSLTDAFNQMLDQIQTQDRGLRQSEGRLRAVLDSSFSAIVVMDAQGIVEDWNPRAERIFGWTREEAIGRDVAGLIIPETLRDAHRSGLRRFLATSEARLLHKVVELSATYRDGRQFPVEVFVRPLQTSGAVSSFCGFITDITERKQARDKLQTQWARLDLLHRITRAIGERQDLHSVFQVVIRRLEDHLPIDFGCICLYDLPAERLTVTSVGARSRPLAVALGLTEQEHLPIDEDGLGRCVGGELVYESDLSEDPSPFARRLVGSGLKTVVLAPLLAEGRVSGVLIAARRAAGSFGTGDCEFLHQLSEHVGLAVHQVQLYAALQRSYEDLRQSQQAVLQQERLRALGQMASGVAHDINNAISPVTIYTDLLLEREPGLSERVREILTVIQQCIHDVAQTVSRMRDFYRKRGPELLLAPIDINQLVQGVIDLTRSRWRDLPQERGVVINVRTELESSLPVILGAEHEIRDALTNLIFNAIDAMPEGGTLQLRTRRNDSGSAVLLEVTDTGVGMDEETKRHCLEPFFTTKGERGTGMGLAMVYGMIERHSAELEIDTAPGLGTTVRLIFSPPTMVKDPTISQPALELPAPMRILIVDDDPLIIESLSETLRADRHQVTTAEGGQAGIDAFLVAHKQGDRFTAVITDLGMPYVDGRRVAAAIKAVAPATPVILLTGWGHRLSAENDIPEHVDRILNKPPKLRELRLALAQLTNLP